MNDERDHMPFNSDALNHIIRPNSEELMARFPFPTPIRREGEPAHSTSLLAHAQTGLVLPSVWLYTSRKYKAVSMEWLQWAYEQPDAELLMCDNEQREDWFREGGDFDSVEMSNWHQTRYDLAEKLRQEGHGDILTRYWPTNEELKAPPSAF
jgi:hypothetical protein